MKIVLQPAPGAVLRIKTKDGRELSNADVETIEMEPHFSTANGQGECVDVEAQRNDGTLIERFLLQASGSSGKLRRIDRKAVAEKVIPLVDRVRKTATGVVAADAKPAAPAAADAPKPKAGVLSNLTNK